MPHDHELRPFEAGHLGGIRWAEEEHAKLIGEKAFDLYQKHPGYSGFCDGRFVAAAGIIVPYPGLGEAWAIAGPLVWTHKTYFHRTIARIMDDMARDLKLR